LIAPGRRSAAAIQATQGRASRQIARRKRRNRRLRRDQIPDARRSSTAAPALDEPKCGLELTNRSGGDEATTSVVRARAQSSSAFWLRARIRNQRGVARREAGSARLQDRARDGDALALASR